MLDAFKVYSAFILAVVLLQKSKQVARWRLGFIYSGAVVDAIGRAIHIQFTMQQGRVSNDNEIRGIQ